MSICTSLISSANHDLFSLHLDFLNLLFILFFFTALKYSHSHWYPSLPLRLLRRCLHLFPVLVEWYPVALQVSHAAADPAPNEARVSETPQIFGPVLHRQLQGSKHRTGIAEPAIGHITWVLFISHISIYRHPLDAGYPESNEHGISRQLMERDYKNHVYCISILIMNKQCEWNAT